MSPPPPAPANTPWESLQRLPAWDRHLRDVDQATAASEISVHQRPIQRGDIIYRPGDPPHHFFIVGAGEVVEQVHRQGRAWLERRLGPGDFFGQQGLYSQNYASTVIVEEPGHLLYLSATSLRKLLELAPSFLDSLLPEKRAQRLRGIPLLRSLEDAEIRWLALATQERTLQPGDVAPMDPPGLWLIDYGWIEVEGPQRLTAGNFFLSSEVLDDSECEVTTATCARYSTHLFFLPAPHVERLAAQMPEVAERLQRPLDIPAELSRVEMFGPAHLHDGHRRHLAQYCAWEFVPAGQNITTQGHPGHSFVILRQGSAVVSSIDEAGQARPSSVLQAPTAFGRTSLLEGRQRNATARAIVSAATAEAPALAGTDLLIIDRRDLEHAFAEHPDLWGAENSLRRIYIADDPQKAKRPYDWMKEDETVDWRGRRHPIWLWLRWLGGPASRDGARMVIAATVAAVALSTLAYYGHFGDTYRTALRVRAHAAPVVATPVDEAADVASTGTPPPATSWHVRAAVQLGHTRAAMGWPLLLLAAAGVWQAWRARARDPLACALLAWGTLYVALFVAGTLTRVDAQFERYSVEFMGRVDLATYPAVVLLAARGAAWAWRAGALWRLAAVALLLGALRTGLDAWLVWLR